MWRRSWNRLSTAPIPSRGRITRAACSLSVDEISLMNRRTACLLLSSTPAAAAELLAGKSREPSRPWIGPDFWSNPLQDWQFRDGRMECILSGGDRHVYLLTREISSRTGVVSLRIKLGRIEGENGPLTPGFAGFRFGIKGKFNDYRDSAI